MTTVADFSIITCTRNSEPWLAECLESVLMQTGVRIEFIVVDGGSTDGTLARIARLPHPVTLLRDVTGGISAAMNAGLAAARGDFIGWLHSDDFYLHPQVLERVARHLRHSGAQWLFGRIRRVIDGRLYPEGFVAPRYSHTQLLRGNFIPHPATFVRRTLMMRAGGFDTRLRYAMDYDLWLRLSHFAPPLQLDDALTGFREHAGSLSTRERSAAMREDLQVRLAHSDRHLITRALHIVRYCVRRQRARLSRPGDLHA